jgi:hypothetical protein
MNKLSLVFALTGAVLLAASPQAKPADAAIEAQIAAEIQLLRSDVKTMSRTLLTDALELSAPEAAAFWPIYDEYELATTKLDDVRLACIKTYLDNFDTMTPAMTEDIAKRIFKFQMDRIKLSETYFKKVSKAVSAQKGARFLQVDTAIRSAKDLQIQARMPLFK